MTVQVPDSAPDFGAGPKNLEYLKFGYLMVFNVFNDMNGVGVKYGEISDGNDC